MPIRSYTNKDIARCQLESAIELYFKREDYVSALTLAGASEEILGKSVKKKGKDNALRNHVSITKDVHEIFGEGEFSEKDEINSANKFRNLVKHMTADGVIHDFQEEAQFMLHRALSNWQSLYELSSSMKMFLNYYYELP